MIERVLLETLVVAELESGAAAWREELGWQTLASGEVDVSQAELWDVAPEAHPRFVLLASPGSSRGFVRLVQGEDDVSSSLERAGLFNAELLCSDVEALFDRLRRSRAFRVLSSPNTYDLSPTGGAVSRSFATRGPGGARATGSWRWTCTIAPSPTARPARAACRPATPASRWRCVGSTPSWPGRESR